MSDEFNFDFDFDLDEEDKNQSKSVEDEQKNINDTVKVEIQTEIEPSGFFLRQVTSAKNYYFPWPHKTGKTAFNETLFNDILDNIDKIDPKNFESDENNPKRKYVNLLKIIDSHEIWEKIAFIFNNPAVKNSIVEHLFKKFNNNNIPESLVDVLKNNDLQQSVYLICDEKGYKENPIIPDPRTLVNMDIYLTDSIKDKSLYFLEQINETQKKFVKIDELDFSKNNFFVYPSTELTWNATNELKKDKWFIRYTIINEEGLADEQNFDFENDL